MTLPEKSMRVFLVGEETPEPWDRVEIDAGGWLICKDFTKDKQLLTNQIMYPPQRVRYVAGMP